MFFSSFSFVGGAAKGGRGKNCPDHLRYFSRRRRKKGLARRCLISMLLPDRRAKSGGGIQQHDKNLLLSPKENYRQCKGKDKKVPSQKKFHCTLSNLLLFSREFFLIRVWYRRLEGEFQTPAAEEEGACLEHALSRLSLFLPPFAYFQNFPPPRFQCLAGWLFATLHLHIPTKSTM